MEGNKIKVEENNNEETIEKVVKSKYTIVLEKPVNFELTEYKEINLDGLEDINTADLLYVERLYNKLEGTGLVPERTLIYSIIIAQKITKLPFEFFDLLSAKDALKIKTMVSNFLLK